MESFNTVFDKILRKEIPATIVYEDEYVLAFKDIQPQAKIHVLVIPKNRARHFAELKEWSAQDTGNFFKSIATVAHALKLTEKGFRVVFNTNNHGCQSVDYIHAHILGGEQLSGQFGA